MGKTSTIGSKGAYASGNFASKKVIVKIPYIVTLFSNFIKYRKKALVLNI